MSSIIIYTALPGKNIQPFTKAAEAGVMREGLAFNSNLNKIQHALSLRPFYLFRSCILRPGCMPGAWSSWSYARRQFAPKIMELSLRLIRVLEHILLVSTRSGRNSTIQVYT